MEFTFDPRVLFVMLIVLSLAISILLAIVQFVISILPFAYILPVPETVSPVMEISFP